MKQIAWIALLALPVVLSACSGTPGCFKTQRYTSAKSLPPLKAPPGLSVPDANNAMTIPSVKSGPVEAFAQTPSGENASLPVTRCLTTPPLLPAGQNG